MNPRKKGVTMTEKQALIIALIFLTATEILMVTQKSFSPQMAKPPKPADLQHNPPTPRPPWATKWIKPHWRWNKIANRWEWVVGHWRR
jgi:hypothetical protein